MTDVELADWITSLRQWGRVSKLVRLEPPALPRSRRLRRELEREAETDPRVRRALDAAIAAEHAKPTVIRRYFRLDDEIRIH